MAKEKVGFRDTQSGYGNVILCNAKMNPVSMKTMSESVMMIAEFMQQ